MNIASGSPVPYDNVGDVISHIYQQRCTVNCSPSYTYPVFCVMSYLFTPSDVSAYVAVDIFGLDVRQKV